MSGEEVRAELRDLQEAIEAFEEAPVVPQSPMWLNYQSLLARQAQLFAELEYTEVDELLLRLDGEPVVAGAIDSSFLGEVLGTFQDAVSSIAQALAGQATRRAPLRQEFLKGSKLRVAATGHGSFDIHLSGPVRHVQRTLEGEREEQVPVFDVAIRRVLDVVEAASPEEGYEQAILEVVGNLGGRSVLHLRNFSELMLGSNARARFVHKPAFGADETRTETFPTSAALRLQRVLSTSRSQERTTRMTGRLVGASWHTGTFDLEVGQAEPERRVISGDVERALRPVVDDLFDQMVDAVLLVTETWSEASAEMVETYRLTSVEPSE